MRRLPKPVLRTHLLWPFLKYEINPATCVHALVRQLKRSYRCSCRCRDCSHDSFSIGILDLSAARQRWVSTNTHAHIFMMVGLAMDTVAQWEECNDRKLRQESRAAQLILMAQSQY